MFQFASVLQLFEAVLPDGFEEVITDHLTGLALGDHKRFVDQLGEQFKHVDGVDPVSEADPFNCREGHPAGKDRQSLEQVLRKLEAACVLGPRRGVLKEHLEGK